MVADFQVGRAISLSLLQSLERYFESFFTVTLKLLDKSKYAGVDNFWDEIKYKQTSTVLDTFKKQD